MTTKGNREDECRLMSLNLKFILARLRNTIKKIKEVGAHDGESCSTPATVAESRAVATAAAADSTTPEVMVSEASLAAKDSVSAEPSGDAKTPDSANDTITSFYDQMAELKAGIIPICLRCNNPVPEAQGAEEGTMVYCSWECCID